VIKPNVFLPLNGRVNGEKETKMKIENTEKEKKESLSFENQI